MMPQRFQMPPVATSLSELLLSASPDPAAGFEQEQFVLFEL